MSFAPLRAVIAMTLAQAPGGGDGFGRLRAALDDADPARRLGAELELRHAATPETVRRLLAELEGAAPNAAAALERLLAEVPLFRGELLACALDGDDRAAALMATAFDLRAAELSPLRPELAELRDARLPWSRSGWRVVRSGPAGASIGLFELLLELRNGGCLSQPVVVRADCLDEGVPAPRADEVALDAWLEIELKRLGLAVRRGAVAAWVMPAVAVGDRELLDTEKEGIELLRLRELERSWFTAALLACRAHEKPRAWREACQLLLRCGLEIPAAGVPDPRNAASLAAARAEWLSPARPTLPAGRRGDGGGPDSLPVAGRRRVLLERAARLFESASADAASFPSDLRRLVDEAAGAASADALLCGELADQLRRSLAARADPGLAGAVEAAASELFIIGRATRPPSGCVVLPPGAPR